MAQQLVAYLGAVLDALGCVPTRQQMVLERFFDDSGDMHLVIHAPLGSRIMRAWGLALRKRFCRHFNFELQAAALEDCLILSLGETHSFDNASIASFLNSASVRQVLIQALLDAPMFGVRWRWNATIALAVQRMRNGKKLPPQWQRNQAEDLVAVVFPDQLACLENLRGEREIPDHPLVQQTISDCLNETMDIAGLEQVLRQLEAGAIELRCMDLTAPSPLAAEIINARPYAFLDDGDAENRRTRAISQNPRDLDDAAMLSIISIPAIEQVQAECWIAPRNPDELHDGLLQLGFLTQEEFTTGCASTGANCGPGGDAALWGHWFKALTEELRAVCVRRTTGGQWWVATERLSEFLAVAADSSLHPDPGALWRCGTPVSRERALVELLRSRLSALGPVTAERLAADLFQPQSEIVYALLTLQNEGFVIRMTDASSGSVHTPGTEPAGPWCERRLLARIHRYSRERRRHAGKPVPPAAFMRFLVAWHGLDAPGADFAEALSQLEGWAAPLAAWEPALLQARCREYKPAALDQLILNGQLSWFRPAVGAEARQQIVAASPICLVPRKSIASWQQGAVLSSEDLPAASQCLLDALRTEGAMFADDLQQKTGLLRPQMEQALGTLVARGLVTADAFSALRWLIRPEPVRRRQLNASKRRGGSGSSLAAAEMLGRWSAVRVAQEQPAKRSQADMETVCSALLRRYGVVFRALLERESLLPPWRYVLSYLRRMEDRGEVLGGRFVDGFSGEQFALSEATGLLQRHVQPAEQYQLATISAADPLNLGGIITPGVRTAALNGHRILLRDGIPLARIQGDDIEILEPDSRVSFEQIQRRLVTVRPIRSAGAER